MHAVGTAELSSHRALEITVGRDRRPATTSHQSVQIGASMGQVVQFSRRSQGFDTEATAVLIAAYESAVDAIAQSGRPSDLCEVAARRIIAMASKGERNPERLCAAALATVTQSMRRHPEPPVRLPHLILIDTSKKIAWARPSDPVSD